MSAPSPVFLGLKTLRGLRPLSIFRLTAFGTLLLGGCASSQPFHPRSDYPQDPWVKSYADAQDCLGGENLAAKSFELPDYPRRAFKSGQQGWVILRLDVDASGATQNVQVERAVPNRYFGGGAKKAAQAWQFAPPKSGPLTNCRVLVRYRLGKVSIGS